MTHMNLLPLPLQKKLLIRRRLSRWGIVWGLCSVVALTVAFVWSNRHSGSKAALAVLNDQVAPIRKLEAENGQMLEQINDIVARQSLLGDLDSAERPLTLVGIVSHSAASTQSRLQVQRFAMHRQEITPTETKAAPAEASEKPETIVQTTLELSGVALDDLAVARFISALRETGIFVQVELKSSLSTQVADNPAKEYLVRCTF
ncbi:MAG: PilN domain-containing protein [Maioricimonas sp. JB049]